MADSAAKIQGDQAILMGAQAAYMQIATFIRETTHQTLRQHEQNKQDYDRDKASKTTNEARSGGTPATVPRNKMFGEFVPSCLEET